MKATLYYIGKCISSDWRRLLLHGILFALLFQILMLIALVVRFQSLPNYVVYYNWAGNILHIINSTPSWSDIFAISAEEWLVEIGQMNYDYGMGLSVWSLNVIPSRIAVLVMMGSMVSLCYLMVGRKECGLSRKRHSVAAVGTGSVLVAMTNVTMSWVVCCATPSWVVGLAMLGLGVSTSLALESLGPALSFSGFTLLFLSVVLLAWNNVKQPDSVMEAENA